jgi:processing peptidase subunit alpha
VFESGNTIRFIEDLEMPLEKTMRNDQDDPRFSIGFKAPSLLDEEFYCVSILHGLMGGGSSFSSGGPGKGIHTRLYARVLNRFAFCENVRSFLIPFEHVSLFGISAQCDKGAVIRMMEVVASELLYMATQITDEELIRAKNKVKSDMFVDLESRIVSFDDLARQVCLWNRRVSSAEHASKIDAVTKQQVLNVAQRIVKSMPIVAALGLRASLAGIPSAQRINQHLNEMLK